MGVRWQNNEKDQTELQTPDKLIHKEARESIDKCIFIQQLLSSTYSYMKKELDSTYEELEDAKLMLDRISLRLIDRGTVMSEIKEQMDDLNPSHGQITGST